MPPLTLITSYNIFQWSSDTWETLDRIGILLGLALPLLSLLAALWAYLKKECIKHWIIGNHFPHIGQETDQQQSWGAIIFTISHPETPKWVTETRNPKAIGLIATEQSLQSANEIKQYAKQQGIQTLGPIIVNDPDNIQETQTATAHLIKRLQQQNNTTIAIDITGGKVTMSLGAFIAAEESSLDTLYVSTQFNYELKKMDLRTAKLISVSSHNKKQNNLHPNK